MIPRFKSAKEQYKYVAQYGYKTSISEKRIFYISGFGPREMIREGEKYDFVKNPPDKVVEKVKPETDISIYVLLGFTMLLSGFMIVALLRSYTNENV